MEKNKCCNDSGVALIAVIIFVMVISIVLMGLLTRTSSQTLSIENQVRQIQAEQLRQGGFWIAHAQKMNGAVTGIPNSILIDGFNVSFTENTIANTVSTSVSY